MRSSKRNLIKYAGLAAIFVMIVVYIPCNSNIGLMTGIEERFFIQQEKYVSDINARFNLSNESTVLYLDAGVAPYYFGVNSSARYICPLPFQRDAPDWNLSGNRAFQQTYFDIMSYNGTYIISEKINEPGDWLHTQHENRNPLLDKLDREYEKVWSDGWVIYKRK